MAENMAGLKRTKYCGEFTKEDIGKQVVACGWVAKRRVLGGLTFIDLRDRSGIVQLTFDETANKQLSDKAYGLRNEFVICAKGTVRMRSSINKDIPTGEIEIEADELKILSESQTPPFEIVSNSQTNEELRLKYRYLDLRRPELKDNIIMRHKITKATRDFFDSEGFIEIETPILIRSTPEGARDFLVPSRLHKGEFYALPQSPQLYKQLSMVAGFDKYVQIARCFRDEDLRADRQPEFTQIDMEMSFVDQEDVMAEGEKYIKYIFKKILNIDVPLPLNRLTYADAMNKYGSDKPDTRFKMEIIDVSDVVKDCGFSVFSSAVENGGSVRAINCENAAGTLTRKEIDKLVEYVKGIGAKGLAWIRITSEATTSSFAKFMTEEQMNSLVSRVNAKEGDVVLFVADKTKTVLSTLGALRLECARKLDIIPNQFNFLWVCEFPFFEYNEETGGYDAMHHPFTSPMDECMDILESDKANVRAKAYDLVLNGVELCSGSIRITDSVLQEKMFNALGIGKEEAQQKFGFLLDAFKYGAPPHGGLGLGIDRLIMLMLGEQSLRDVIAYPKVQNMSELMTACPSPVDDIQLNELGILLSKENNND